MNTDVEFHIRQNYPWTKLPANVKQVRGLNGGQTSGRHRCVLGGGEEKERVNVTAVPSVFDRQLSGSQRFYLSAITALESLPTISSLEPLKLYRPCLTSLRSHDWLGDRRLHMMLAAGCSSQILHLNPGAEHAAGSETWDTNQFNSPQRKLVVPTPPSCAAADVDHCKYSTITCLSSLKTENRNHIKPENLCVTWFVQIVVHCVDDASSSSFSSLDTDFSVMYVLFLNLHTFCICRFQKKKKRCVTLASQVQLIGTYIREI